MQCLISPRKSGKVEQRSLQVSTVAIIPVKKLSEKKWTEVKVIQGLLWAVTKQMSNAANRTKDTGWQKDWMKKQPLLFSECSWQEWHRTWGRENNISPNMVVGQPPLSMPRRSSPIPEKLPKEKVLRVGETSKWSSWSRKGTPMRRCRFFPAWWNGIDPLRSRSLSSFRLLNCRKRSRYRSSWEALRHEEQPAEGKG